MGTSLNRGSDLIVALDAVTLAAERTSDAIYANGYNTVTVYASHTRDAATDVTIWIDQSPDGGSNWYKTVIGTKSGGTVEVAELALTETGTADFDYAFPPVAINCTHIRIRADGASGGADDDLTVKVLLAAHDSATVL